MDEETIGLGGEPGALAASRVSSAPAGTVPCPTGRGCGVALSERGERADMLPSLYCAAGAGAGAGREKPGRGSAYPKPWERYALKSRRLGGSGPRGSA